MSSPVVWIDGAAGDRIDPADRGFTLGDGVFDTLLALDRVPFAGEAHLERLVGQAAAIGIDIDADRVRAGWRDVLGHASARHLVLRTTVSRGAAARGLWPAEKTRPTLVVSAVPWDSALFGRASRLATSTIRRNPTAPASRLKSLNYLDNVLAAREAARAGVDDALLLNTAGRVACATIANVFAILGGRLVTPPPDEGVQPGIMRALVLEEARAAGWPAEERPLDRETLQRAEAVFLTNSLRFVCPVTELDGVALTREEHGLLASLQNRLAVRALAECGCDPRRP